MNQSNSTALAKHRTTLDRVRYVCIFELLGLVILLLVLTPLGFELIQLGLLAVFISIIASVWNYLFGILFDHYMLRRNQSLHKSVRARLVFSLLFELGLLVFSLPLIAYMLTMSMWDAFVFDLGLIIFYLCYAYVFSWAYEHVFPPPC